MSRYAEPYHPMSVTEWKSSVIWGIAVEMISRSYAVEVSVSAWLRLRQREPAVDGQKALLLYLVLMLHGSAGWSSRTSATRNTDRIV